MKWVSSKYDEVRGCNVWDIKHEKLLKFLGFRLQFEAIRGDYEFRMSFLRFSYSPAPLQMNTKALAIPIPFMGRDHGLHLGKSKRHEEYAQGNDRQFKYHTEIKIHFY